MMMTHTDGIAVSQRMRKQMQRTGKTPWGCWLWTKHEDAKVLALYPDYRTLNKQLKRRTIGSIKKRASHLGIAKKCHCWTARENSILRKLYPGASKEVIFNALPELTWEQIKSRANYAGYYRNKPLYKETGHAILDHIRQRAYELKINMVDLDEIAGTKKYFQSAQWHGKKTTNAKAVMKAIEALAGEINIQWEVM